VLHQSFFAWDLAFRLRTGPCKIKCPSPPFTLPSEWSARGSAAAPAPVDNKVSFFIYQQPYKKTKPDPKQNTTTIGPKVNELGTASVQ
jgi:hypothetical protein